MNALYHAPTDKDGKELFAGKSLKELAQLDHVSPIEVRYACSGRYFGVSVRDGGGSLSRDRALEYMRKAQATAAIETKTSGAGLGLVSVLKSVSKLVFNLEFGSSTEVVALFDMELFAKGKVGARSLHLFAAPESPPEPEESVTDEQKSAAPAAVAANDETTVPVRARGPVGAWIFAAILGAVVASLGTAFYLKSSGTATASASPSASPRITVRPTPKDATIMLDGKEAIAADTPFTLHENQMVEVSRDGFQPKRIPLENVESDLVLVVDLVPAAKPH
jgi:hypothetical protein